MKLALIGVGLIGGSFARALRTAGKVNVVTGFDTQPDALRRAIELGVIDRSVETPAQAVGQADLVMIATPVGAIGGVLRAIAPHLGPAAIVTDVGSTKSGVIEAARDALGSAFDRFVPGHPIAGREHSGVEYSGVELFKGKLFLSTPVERTGAEAVRQVEALWRSVGCRTDRMAPEEHDKVFAAVSHLPHLLAFALVAQIAADVDAAQKFALAGAGFRDFTRIAASSPALWSDVCVANHSALSDELKQHRNLLEELQRAIDECDGAALQSVFTRARAALA